MVLYVLTLDFKKLISFSFLMNLGHALGRDSFLENETIYPVALLFDDPEPIARKNAHMCVMMISETPPGS